MYLYALYFLLNFHVFHIIDESYLAAGWQTLQPGTIGMSDRVDTCPTTKTASSREPSNQLLCSYFLLCNLSDAIKWPLLNLKVMIRT